MGLQFTQATAIVLLDFRYSYAFILLVITPLYSCTQTRTFSL